MPVLGSSPLEGRQLCKVHCINKAENLSTIIPGGSGVRWEVGHQAGYLGTLGRQPSSEDHMSDSNGLESSGLVV